MKEDAKTRDAIALFLLYESMGGKVEVLDEIKRLQENRCYTKKQAYDERKKVERAYRRAASLGLLNEYGFMRELDDKMKAILLGS